MVIDFQEKTIRVPTTTKSTFVQEQEQLFQQLVPEIEQEFNFLVDSKGLNINQFFQLDQKMKPLAADIRLRLEGTFLHRVQQQLRILTDLLQNWDDNSYIVWKNAQKLAKFYSAKNPDYQPPTETTSYWLIKQLTTHKDDQAVKTMVGQITDNDIADLDPIKKLNFESWVKEYINTHQGQKLQDLEEKRLVEKLNNPISIEEFRELLESNPEYAGLLDSKDLASVNQEKLELILNVFLRLSKKTQENLELLVTESKGDLASFNTVFNRYQDFYQDYVKFLKRLASLNSDLNGGGIPTAFRQKIAENHRMYTETTDYYTQYKFIVKIDRAFTGYSLDIPNKTEAA